MYLFTRIEPHSFESMGEFIGRILGFGFEGAAVELLVIVIASVATFSIVAWLFLRRWGPLRHQAQ